MPFPQDSDVRKFVKLTRWLTKLYTSPDAGNKYSGICINFLSQSKAPAWSLAKQVSLFLQYPLLGFRRCWCWANDFLGLKGTAWSVLFFLDDMSWVTQVWVLFLPPPFYFCTSRRGGGSTWKKEEKCLLFFFLLFLFLRQPNRVTWRRTTPPNSRCPPLTPIGCRRVPQLGKP